MKVRIKNISGTPQHIPAAGTTLQPGATITIERTSSQLDAEIGLKRMASTMPALSATPPDGAIPYPGNFIDAIPAHGPLIELTLEEDDYDGVDVTP